MNGLEQLLSLATEVSKLALTLAPGCLNVRFRTRNLPWGWSGGVTTSADFLDLRGPFGARLFVTAETPAAMNELRRAQEALLGCHFPSIVLKGRHGVGGSGANEGYFVKWTSIPSRRPDAQVVFLYQTHREPEQAETDFQSIIDCVELVEMLPGY